MSHNFHEMFYNWINHINEALSRSQMPQVSQNDMSDVQNSISEMGVKCESGVVKCNKLKPLQDGINREKVENIKADIEAGEDLGHIIVSETGDIIDGHHRWVATKEALGDDSPINIVKIHLPTASAFKLMHSVT